MSTYHSLSDFRSQKARSLFQNLQQMKREYVKMQNYLQKQRDEYAMGSADRKARLKNDILDAETRMEKMELDIDKQETAVRNEELKTK